MINQFNSEGAASMVLNIMGIADLLTLFPFALFHDLVQNLTERFTESFEVLRDTFSFVIRPDLSILLTA